MPSMTDILLEYRILRTLAEYSRAVDLLNLAKTSNTHHELIRGKDKRLETLLGIGLGCNGYSTSLRRTHQLHVMNLFTGRGSRNVTAVFGVPVISAMDAWSPEKEERVMNAYSCIDAGGGQPSKGKRCDRCKVPVCNSCRFHQDYRATSDEKGDQRFIDELDPNTPYDERLRQIIMFTRHEDMWDHPYDDEFQRLLDARFQHFCVQLRCGTLCIESRKICQE
ncbi:hypothetical protein LTR37_000562 [Vermiconidia calcicola]|uniref:Uncharacterized protein n=1 Tax=Vermiconidia calcicola TaxID=1690605 RepID=A0ACC3NXE7_9PEZI|nr:hypothetical protein LTR37_000562 [Vermiconidia calcicola]